MRKKRQARTRRSSKAKRPYKYKGLTPYEAKVRARKAWITRRARYGTRRKFAAYDPFDDESAPSFKKGGEAFNEGKAFDKVRDVSGFSDPLEMGQTIGGQKKSFQGPGKGRLIQTEDQLREEARKIHELENLQDKETRRRLILSDEEVKKLPKREQEKYNAFLESFHSLEDRQRLQELNIEQLNRDEPMSRHEAEQILAYQSAAGRRIPKGESWQEGSMLRPGEQEPGLAFLHYAPSASKDARKSRTGKKPLESRDQTLERLRQVMKERVDPLDVLHDTEHKELSEIFDKDLKKIASGIAMSHYGTTEADRLIGKKAARTAANTLANRITKESDRRKKWVEEEKRIAKLQGEEHLMAKYKDSRSATEKAGDMKSVESVPFKLSEKKEDPRLAHKTTVEEYYGSRKGEGLKGHIKSEFELSRRKGFLPFGYKSRDERGRKIPIQNRISWQEGAIQKGTFTKFKDNKPFEEAEAGIIPNKMWKYTLRRRPDPEAVLSSPVERRKGYYFKEGEIPLKDDVYTKLVNPWDTSTEFHAGSVDPTGRLREGQWNEIVNVVPATAPAATKRFTSRTHTELGERGYIGTKPDKDRTVAEHIIVETSAVPKPTEKRLRGYSDERYNEYLVWADLGDKRPGWKTGPVNEEDPNYDVFGSRARPTDDVTAMGGRKGRQFSVPEEDYRLYQGPKEIKRVHKDVKITYVPPGTPDIGLKDKSRDYFMVRTPEIATGGIKDPFGMTSIISGGRVPRVVGEHAVFRSINEDSTGPLASALRWGVFEPERHSRRIERDRQIQEVLSSDPRYIDPKIITRIENDPVFRGQIIEASHAEGNDRHETEKLLTGLVGSAATATLYKARKAGNTAGVQSINDRLKKTKVGKMFNWNVAGEMARTSLREKTGQQGEYGKLLLNMALHPGTSMSGSVRPGGIRPRKIYGRKSFIRPSKVLEREFDLSVHDIEHIIKTERSILEDSARPGIRGYAARRAKENTLKWVNQEAEDGGIFPKYIQRANDVLRADRGKPFKYRGDDKIEREVSHLTPDVFRAASRSKSKILELENVHKDLQTRLKGHTMQEAPIFPRFARIKTGNLTPSEKHLLIGGAVAAGALGAGYLYNRHVNKKRAEQGKEPIAYYNRFLPPSFKSPVPTPSWQTTSSVRIPKTELNDLLQISNNKIITGGRVHFDRKRVTLRPYERSNEFGDVISPGASVGFPRIRGRSKSVQDSYKNLFNVDVERAAKNKKTFRKEGGQISIGGKKLPFYASFGDIETTKLRSNPNKLTDSDRKAIVAAFGVLDRDAALRTDRGRAALAEEQRVKDFYSRGRRDKIVDMFEDRDFVRLAKADTSAKYNTDPGRLLQRAQGLTGIVHLKDRETGKTYSVMSDAINEPNFDQNAKKLSDIRKILDGPVPLEPEHREKLQQQAQKLKDEIGTPYSVVSTSFADIHVPNTVPLMLHGDDDVLPPHRSFTKKSNLGSPDPRYQAYQTKRPAAKRPKGGFSHSDQNKAMMYGEDWLDVPEHGAHDARIQREAAESVLRARAKKAGVDVSKEDVRDTFDQFNKGVEDAVAYERGKRIESSHLRDSKSNPGPLVRAFNKGRKKTFKPTGPRDVGDPLYNRNRKARVEGRIQDQIREPKGGYPGRKSSKKRKK